MLVSTHAASADPSSADVQAQIDSAYAELEDVIEAYNGINEELESTQAALADVVSRVEDLTADLGEATEDAQSVAVAAYRRSGSMGSLSAVLSAESSDGFLDQLALIRQINRSQQASIDEYADLKDDLDEENSHYTDLLNQQTTKQGQLADRQTAIEENISDLEALKSQLTAEELAAAASSSSSSSSSSATAPAVSGSAGAAVSFAYAQLGKPYVWGADGPNGYDCSGLTSAAWAAAGVYLPHNARQQWNTIAHIGRSSLQPGDLVFYRSLGHVGLYVGSGNIIHAPHTGDVVKISNIDYMTPYGYGRPS